MRKLDQFITKKYDKLLSISKTLTGTKDPNYVTTGAFDLLHETIEILYKSNQDKINELIKKKQLVFYIVRIMINHTKNITK